MAIDKLQKGNVYDIVFMDHMMPEMDGIEATRRIRSMGYMSPIVALTANAVAGQADIFLENGFDDFISKPIDIRLLNTLLKKYIRDKQSPEVLEAAKHHTKKITDSETDPLNPQNDNTQQKELSPQLVEYFLLDARKADETVKAIFDKSEPLTDEDINLYTISVHAMKTALSNINEFTLSKTAASLEQAGKNKETVQITNETPEFIGELRKVIEKLTVFLEMHKSKTGSAGTVEDYELLKQKATIIKEAFESYDKKTAKDILAELRQLTWQPNINELLTKMSEQLLSGDSEGLQKSVETINSL